MCLLCGWQQEQFEDLEGCEGRSVWETLFQLLDNVGGKLPDACLGTLVISSIICNGDTMELIRVNGLLRPRGVNLQALSEISLEGAKLCLQPWNAKPTPLSIGFNTGGTYAIDRVADDVANTVVRHVRPLEQLAHEGEFLKDVTKGTEGEHEAVGDHGAIEGTSRSAALGR